MNDQGEFLRAVVLPLEAAGIPYMVTGSMASSFHGEPRATHDIDIVIAPRPSQLEMLLRALETKFYVSAEAARDALARRSAFNVIDTAGGWKADLIVSRDRSFSQEELSRRWCVEVLGVTLHLVSPEDAILSKLEWARAAQSERQFHDALGVARVQGADLDMAYLDHWASVLDLRGELDRLLKERDST